MLKIEGLSKTYPGGVRALDGVSLGISDGMFGLLGPNGAGKSTLMKILAGLLEPTSGRVELDGVDIVARPEWVWQRLGYLPQDFGFYPELKGAAMLRYLLELKGIDPPGGLAGLCEELLEKVNLGHAAERRVGTYSTGMVQRLGIAQAIAGEPRLIIVDEPTAGLDPEERIRFYGLLSDLAGERLVILSTHIVEDVSVLCPSFSLIRKGRVVVTTTPGKAREELAGAIFEGSVERSEIPDFARQWTVTQTIQREGESRVRIHEPERQPPPGFEPVEPSLEDAYLVLVRRGAENP